MEMHGKLKGKEKRKSYLATLKPEFAPQEVQDIIRETLNRIPKSDIDTIRIRAPQYADPAKRTTMQADMDKLDSPEGTTAELHKLLNDVVARAKGNLYGTEDEHIGA